MTHGRRIQDLETQALPAPDLEHLGARVERPCRPRAPADVHAVRQHEVPLVRAPACLLLNVGDITQTERRGAKLAHLVAGLATVGLFHA